MKILKIFGIVVGIHVFALVLIFANPGCSATTKPAPAPADTAVTSAPVSSSSAQYGGTSDLGITSAPITFNPDAPATAAPNVRFTPTRPGTPAAGTLVAEPVADVTPATTYTVKSGDNLWTIARKNHLTVAQLTAANSISGTTSLRPGQKLVIPGKPASPTVAATANPAASGGSTAVTVAPKSGGSTGSSTVKHVVKSGETLGGIARTYGVSAGEIAVRNNISDPARIRPGMELVIPGWDSPTPKSTRSTTAKSSPPPAAPPAQTQSAPEPKAPPATVPTINIEPAPETSAPATEQPPQTQVPVIRIDDAPVTPAPNGGF